MKGQAELHLNYVVDLLQDRQFIIGDQLMAADVQLTFSLQAARRSKLIGNREALSRYLSRMEERPAYLRAINKSGPFELGLRKPEP